MLIIVFEFSCGETEYLTSVVLGSDIGVVVHKIDERAVDFFGVVLGVANPHRGHFVAQGFEVILTHRFAVPVHLVLGAFLAESVDGFGVQDFQVGVSTPSVVPDTADLGERSRGLRLFVRQINVSLIRQAVVVASVLTEVGEAHPEVEGELGHNLDAIGGEGRFRLLHNSHTFLAHYFGNLPTVAPVTVSEVESGSADVLDVDFVHRVTVLAVLDGAEFHRLDFGFLFGVRAPRTTIDYFHAYLNFLVAVVFESEIFHIYYWFLSFPILLQGLCHIVVTGENFVVHDTTDIDGFLTLAHRAVFLGLAEHELDAVWVAKGVTGVSDIVEITLVLGVLPIPVLFDNRKLVTNIDTLERFLGVVEVVVVDLFLDYFDGITDSSFLLSEGG